MGDLSPHFSAREFTDHRTGHLVPPPAKLLAVLERVRALRGRPLRIVSGHRCPSTNTPVGGAPRSRHLKGDAVDIPTGYVTAEEAEAAGAVGIGVLGHWAVHLDTRPGGPARWQY